MSWNPCDSNFQRILREACASAARRTPDAGHARCSYCDAVETDADGRCAHCGAPRRASRVGTAPAAPLDLRTFPALRGEATRGDARTSRGRCRLLDLDVYRSCQSGWQLVALLVDEVDVLGAPVAAEHFAPEALHPFVSTGVCGSWIEVVARRLPEAPGAELESFRATAWLVPA